MAPPRPAFPVPAPLQLAAACCARAVGAVEGERIRSLAEDAEWTVMLRLFRRHRIEALVWRGLQAAGVELPAALARQLQGRADGAAAANMAAAQLMAVLNQRFTAAGVDLLFIKGLTLGQLAYGNPLVKSAWDIDLLVAKDDVGRAAGLLSAEGFACTVPGPDGGAQAVVRWHREAKESTWYREDGLTIDLHSELVEHEMLLPGVGLASPRQDVRIADGLLFPTLTMPDLYAYLAVHGGWSGWFRLKWPADLAALLVQLSPDDIAQLHGHAAALGAGRASSLALLLCDWLFELPLGAELAEELAGDRHAQALLRRVQRALTGRFMLEELTSTWWMHRVQFGLVGGARYKFAQTGEELRRVRWQVARRLQGART